MRKKNIQDDEEKENSDRWMLTYSDMITLLLALFIILYSMSQQDAAKFEAIAQQFSNAFHVSNGTGNGKGSASGTGYDGSGTGYVIDVSDIDAIQTDDSVDSANSDSSGDDSSDTGGSGGYGNVQGPLDEIYQTLSQYVNDNNLQDEISLTNTSSYVQIRIKGVLMFYPDSPKMLDSSKPIIGKISGALKSVYDRVDHITISGNTADVGEHNEQSDSRSWYLSINRADTVRQSLVDDGLKEDKLSLEGYAHYNPIAPNDNEADRAKNRRAEITVYKFETGQNSQTGSTVSTQSTGQTTQATQDEQAAQADDVDQTDN